MTGWTIAAALYVLGALSIYSLEADSHDEPFMQWALSTTWVRVLLALTWFVGAAAFIAVRLMEVTRK